MSTRARFDQDPNYPAFVERYANDIVLFAKEVLGMNLDKAQADFLRHTDKPKARTWVLVDGDGARSPLAPLALHRLFFRDGAHVQVACPTSVLREGSDYRELAHTVANSHPWIGRYMRISGKGISLGSGFNPRAVMFRAARAHAPENLAGFYGPHHCWLVENAMELSAACLQVIAAPCGPGHSVFFSHVAHLDKAPGSKPAPAALKVVNNVFGFSGLPPARG